MAVGDLYQITNEMEQDGNFWEWIWNLQMIAGTVDPNTLDDLAVAWNLNINPILLGVIGASVFHRYTRAAPLPGVDEIPGEAPPITQAGTVPGENLPSNMAVKYYWTTTAPNSKFNGRTNMSGIPHSYQNEGVVGPLALASYQALGNVLLNNFVNIGAGNAEFQPVVVSRYENGIKRAAPVPFAITEYGIATAVGNMRRRTRKGRVVEVV